MKTPPVDASGAASVGAAGSGLIGFHGSDGQWKGLSFTAGETDGLDAVESSSDDSSLVKTGVGGGEVVGGTSIRKFLSGDQPAGRRLVNT